MADSSGQTVGAHETNSNAPWLIPPSYAPDSPDTAELPWALKPPPQVEAPVNHDFVVVPRDGSVAPPRPAVETNEPAADSGHWNVRESEHQPQPVIIPINEALIPQPPPPPRLQRVANALMLRWDRATPRQRLGFSTGGAALVAGALLGMLLSTVFRAAPQSAQIFPGKTYHVPQLFAGVGIAPTPSAQASALLDGLTPLAPPNAPAEVADYADATGNVDYFFAVVQDNIGTHVQRFDSDLASQFPNLETETQVDKTANGITISCGTVPSRSSVYQGCTWYNNFAFGAYIDNVATTPAQALSTLAPVLQHMTDTSSTRGVNAS